MINTSIFSNCLYILNLEEKIQHRKINSSDFLLKYYKRYKLQGGQLKQARQGHNKTMVLYKLTVNWYTLPGNKLITFYILEFQAPNLFLF